jgi:tetratricopeptide (TPR) repeat protein
MTGENQAGPVDAVPRATQGDSPFGAYLSGRVAAASNDMNASADYYLDALKHDPGNETLMERTFTSTLSNGRFDEALTLARQLSKKGAAPTLAPLLLVLDDIKAGHYDAALAKSAKMPDGGFNTLVAPLTRAWILAGEKKWDDAIAALEPLKNSSSFKVFYHYHLALIETLAGNPGAEKAYQDTLSTAGGASPRTLIAYGRYLAGTGRGGEAMKLYDDYLKAEPGNLLMQGARDDLKNNKAKPVVSSPAAGLAEVFVDTAQALNRSSTRAPAIVYAQLARFLMPQDDETLFLLATLHEASNQEAAAIATYGAITPESPLYRGAQVSMAVARYRTGQHEKALTQLEALYKAQPGDRDVALTLADVYHSEKETQKARAIYDDVIAGLGTPQPSDWSLFYARGALSAELGDWDKSQADMKKGLELSPDEPILLNFLGYTWVDRGQNLDEALAMIEKAVKLQPGDGNIMDSLGWALFKLGRYQDAVDNLEHAVQLVPQSPEINEHLGDAYWEVGRFNEARFQWSHAIAMGAKGKDATVLEAKMELAPHDKLLPADISH